MTEDKEITDLIKHLQPKDALQMAFIVLAVYFHYRSLKQDMRSLERIIMGPPTIDVRMAQQETELKDLNAAVVNINEQLKELRDRRYR